VHAIRLRPTVTVPPEAHAALRAVHDQMGDAAGEWMSGEEGLRLFRTRFTEGAEVTIAYEPVDADVAAALRAVRQGRQQADVAVFAVHAHEGDRDPARPMPHLRDLAHAAIDAGADVVAISGPHVVAPVEVYRGRPILYGLGNFVWSDVGGPLSLDFWERTRAAMGDRAPDPTHATESELLALLNTDGFADPWVFRAVLAEVVVGDGIDVRLHPVDLGFGASVTVSGVPRAADPPVAAEIVARLADLSAPYGSSIESIDGIGVLHL
jgi:poly-gamma-glutamate synthesis protein (capsule biosynthesis protein)